MADFDPSKYPGYRKSTDTSGFDPGKYPGYSKDVGAEARRRLMQGMQQRMLSTEDVGRGIRSGLQNLGAFATSPLPQSMQIPRYDPQPTSSYGQGPIEAGKIISSFIPGVGAEKAVAGGLGAIEQIPSWISRVAGGAAGGAAASPSVDVSPTTGAILGGAGAAIPEAAMGLIGRYLGKNVTPEQFQSAREAIPANIKAPIGELAKSPSAQKAYGGTQSIAFSQADTPFNQLYNHLTEGVDSLTEGAPKTQTPNQDLYSDMVKSHDKLKQITSDGYDDFAKTADENKIPFNRDTYDSYVDDKIENLKDEFERSGTAEDLDSKTLSTLETLKKDRVDDFKEANTQRQNINRTIKKNLSEDPTYSDKILLGAKEALDSSMRESAKVNPKILEKFLFAKNARIAQGKMEYLNDKEKTPFYKIRVKHGTPDNLINSYLKTGKNKDYSPLLENMTNYLSDDGRKILANAHINPTEDMSLAKKMTNINKLSPTQRDLLFGEKAPIANNLSKISNIYGEAKVANFTPKTGWTGGKRLQAITELFAALGLSSTVGVPHSAALATAAALPAYGQLTQRALRSEALKNAHMRYLQRAGKGALTKSTPTGQAMRTALLSLIGGNQNGA